MNKRRTIKEYFSDKTDKEIFAILLFFSCIILMVVLAVFRFCGIGYFANTYSEHKLVPWVQVAIQVILKWIDAFLILAILTTIKTRFIIIISLLWNCLYFVTMPESVVMLLDIFYMVALPFILSKFDYKYITYGIMLVIGISLYQSLMMQARYTIDLTEKFNYVAMIASVFDYKVFLSSVLLMTKYIWRYNTMQDIKTPNPEEKNDWSGGGCFLFWGKFDKACEVIGKVVVGVCTLGIAPLAVHLYRKAKAKKVQPVEPETQDEKTE